MLLLCLTCELSSVDQLIQSVPVPLCAKAFEGWGSGHRTLFYLAIYHSLESEKVSRLQFIVHFFFLLSLELQWNTQSGVAMEHIR